ncbi:MAG TPA: enoyl-CoA hydratase/isomerase family protein, partial [Bacteroidetes bacterium]|nr:enoyl-CoA hydratase/isomerase family protein [Bacteroidota bacterium]HEX04393.1 enoyl-CoA hydratase/isomerase family protein [Bacteroidota bacterium]
MGDFKHIRVSTKDGRADVVLNRLPYNILNIEMMNEMIDCFRELAIDTSLRVVVISSLGKAFSSGVDVTEHVGDTALEMLNVFNNLFNALWDVRAVTIAAVDGLALGGGCELAVGCDILLASSKAKLGQPEISVGVIPPMAVAVFPMLIGRNRAIAWLLSGRIYSAEEAHAAGLVNHVLPEDSFEDDVTEYCSHFLNKSAAVIALGKRAI